MEALKNLQRLKESLQTAAMLCGPPSNTSRMVSEESFDSADLEEEDQDQGVGVDERAAELDPDNFLDSDEVEWHSSAVWIMGKEETVTFLFEALVSHLAPLYVPYAPITATTPVEIVPEDVQGDIRVLLEQFVENERMNTMSVQDVKDSLSALLGDEGLSLLPYEYPLFQEFDFGVFSSVFEDTEQSWEHWIERFDVSESDEEDDLVQTSQEDSFVVGDEETSLANEQHEEQLESTESASAYLRKQVACIMNQSDGTTTSEVSHKFSECLDAVEMRMTKKKNFRNIAALLAMLGGSALTASLSVRSVEQFVLHAVLVGPLSFIELACQDPPRAALRAVQTFAERATTKLNQANDARWCESCDIGCMGLAMSILDEMKQDDELVTALCGWGLLKVMEACHSKERHQQIHNEELQRSAILDAAQECASQIIHGPFAGLAPFSL